MHAKSRIQFFWLEGVDVIRGSELCCRLGCMFLRTCGFIHTHWIDSSKHRRLPETRVKVASNILRFQFRAECKCKLTKTFGGTGNYNLTQRLSICPARLTKPHLLLVSCKFLMSTATLVFSCCHYDAGVNSLVRTAPVEVCVRY